MKEYLRTVEEVLEENKTSSNGLTKIEAEKRLEANGKNKLAEGKKTGVIVRFLCEMKDPMVIVLLVAALISLVTAIYANESFADVIIILLVVIINAILGVYQESKAEKAIEALQEMSAATSKVIREGHILTIKTEDLVCGDIIVLEAGDSIPADARIIESFSLKVEEAALTGESVPVSKKEEAINSKDDVLLGDRNNMVYMGSIVVYGRCKAVVVATGMQTEMGKIANALSLAKDGDTPLQKKLNQLSKILSVLVLGICVIIFIIDIIRSYPNITGEGMLDTFMVAVSLAVAAIPEGLAAVVTIVLAIGVTNMSKRNAIIRKLTAVETLGCTQIICSDKTGTLTQNKMTVVDHYGDENKIALIMSLCNDAEVEDGAAVGEPTEAALVNYALSLKMEKPNLKEKYPRIAEVPFDSKRKMMTTFHKDGSKVLQFTKGAPDIVLSHCKFIFKDGKKVEITEADRKDIMKKNKDLADKALRVLAASMNEFKELPQNIDENVENDLIFVGLTGMIDPIRPEVKVAINECRDAGIRPIMITGDHKDTAVAIAMELGIINNASNAITGADLNNMSDEEFMSKIETFSVYARVQPEHKVRIVNGWRSLGKITAMTGDGVNDAPSIKNADIGVGMGITGTDVTKNVADMVLADDNFATIVSAVEEGRRVYSNIRKSIQFLLSSNLAEVLAIFVATILGFTILKPVHLLWINLITDCFPALSLGMEKSEDDSMKKPPRSSNEGIFSNGLGVDVLVQGVLITLLTLTAYFVGHFMESGKWEITNSLDGMTMAFLTLSLVEIFHSFNMRSRRKSIFQVKWQNKFLWGAMLLSFILTTAVIYVPFLRNAFGFEFISFAEYAAAIGIAFAIIPILELIKLVQRAFAKRKLSK